MKEINRTKNINKLIDKHRLVLKLTENLTVSRERMVDIIIDTFDESNPNYKLIATKIRSTPPYRHADVSLKTPKHDQERIEKGIIFFSDSAPPFKYQVTYFQKSRQH